ncbi:hypothetical protein C0Q70_13542 [Pomacea canaliculata]|uniref:Glucosamine 6-phosphate N-acetyltransferase n=1 Tax=Pomacea canaliculata TaxID=400727 RepID=A0A2T7NXI7_POMCA|nr:glucosamine 6-phosphate N-acetyltransferase-like [Pomacea canaliculata]PVD25878.1 hypothetical protein C0Q70_13542 [Pomacea canaliculata]
MSILSENGVADIFLFDAAILESLDYTKCKGSYKGGITPENPGENLKIRPLALGDYHNGYMELLQQLTKVGEVTKAQFEDRFSQMKACPDTYYIIVIENQTTGQVIGSATLVKEQKFIHGASARARVEDVVVSDLYRGKQLGKILLDVAVLLSKAVNSYKVSLECKDHMVEFYSQFGFIREEGQNFMQQRWFD